MILIYRTASNVKILRAAQSAKIIAYSKGCSEKNDVYFSLPMNNSSVQPFIIPNVLCIHCAHAHKCGLIFFNRIPSIKYSTFSDTK